MFSTKGINYNFTCKLFHSPSTPSILYLKVSKSMMKFLFNALGIVVASFFTTLTSFFIRKKDITNSPTLIINQGNAIVIIYGLILNKTQNQLEANLNSLRDPVSFSTFKNFIYLTL